MRHVAHEDGCLRQVGAPMEHSARPLPLVAAAMTGVDQGWTLASVPGRPLAILPRMSINGATVDQGFKESLRADEADSIDAGGVFPLSVSLGFSAAAAFGTGAVAGSGRPAGFGATGSPLT